MSGWPMRPALPVQGCIHCRPGRLCEYHKSSNNPLDGPAGGAPVAEDERSSESATAESTGLHTRAKSSWELRAEAAESQLAALRAALEPIALREHERAVGANALFSVEHWKHNAGQEHPHEPDDDSFIAFENCKHPLCAAVRTADQRQVAPVRIGAFDYVENADGTVTRKDWRDE